MNIVVTAGLGIHINSLQHAFFFFIVFLLKLNKDLMVVLGIPFFLNPERLRKERFNRPSSFSITNNVVINIGREAAWYLKIILMKLNCSLW